MKPTNRIAVLRNRPKQAFTLIELYQDPHVQWKKFARVEPAVDWSNSRHWWR